MTDSNQGVNWGGVLACFGFQIPWLALAIFVWNLPFFFSSMLYDSAWWGMLFILLSAVAMLPSLAGFGILMQARSNASQRYKEQMWGGIFMLPAGILWAYLWLIALPFTWTLLPWGVWEYNWWKIFPYIGLSCMAVGAVLGPLAMIFGSDPEPLHELGSRYLQKGMKGSDVREVQQLINKHRVSCEVDGVFGPQTEDAVKQFQSRCGFGFNQDGIVGNKTLAALRDEPDIESHVVNVDSDIESHVVNVDSSIEILDVTPGQPIRFRINDVPSSNEAWVGIYPESAGDHEHGEHSGGRWHWLRDIDVNNASFGSQSEGRWSIRVFSDGGYTLQDKVDFSVGTSRTHVDKPDTKPSLSNSQHLHDPAKAEEFTRALGLQVGGAGHPFVGNWQTKGLYAYRSGQYSGIAYFGSGGSEHDRLAYPSVNEQYRPWSRHDPRMPEDIRQKLITLEDDDSSSIGQPPQPARAEPSRIQPAVYEMPKTTSLADAKLSTASKDAAKKIRAKTSGLNEVFNDLQNVTFASDRDEIIKNEANQPQLVEVVIDKVERTTGGFRLAEQLKDGMTVFGKTVEGVAVEMHMPSAMNNELKILGQGSSLRCKASVAGWNTIHKLIQMDWIE